MKHLNFAFSLALFVPLHFAFAQERAANDTRPLALEEAVAQAEEKNPDLIRLKAAADRVSWTKMEALSGYLPHVSAGYDHYFTSDYLRENILFGGSTVNFPAAFPQDNLTLDASITVFDGLESLYKYKAALLNSEAANLDVSRAKFKVEENIRLAFFQALAAQKLLEVAKQNVTTLEEHLSKAKLTQRNGYGTQFDVLRIDATLAEAVVEEQAAGNNVQTSREALSEAMGLEQPDTRPLIGELPVLQGTDVPQKLSLSATDREDLQSMNKKTEAAQHMATAAKGFWYPSVSLFAEEQYYKFGNFDPVVQSNTGYQNASFFGLRLKWNLFDGGSSYARDKQASAAAVEAQNQTQKLRLELPQEFDLWSKKFYYSVSLYRARVRALGLYQESVRLASLGVRAGSRTHTEMLDAELDLFRARGGVVKAQVDAVEALGKLELAAGHKFSRNP